MDEPIICYECQKILRNTDGKDLEDIHTSSDGEDVCEQCCDFCNGKAIACDECGDLLRDGDGRDIAHFFTSEDGDNLCDGCVAGFGGW